MPFTPFHLGPGLVIGILLFSYISLPVFLFANMMPDLEPLAVIISGGGVHHGFWHSFAGATILAIVLSIVAIAFKKPIKKFSEKFLIKQEISWKNVLPAAFLGTFLHVFLDSILYHEMNPFYPITGNPFVIGTIAFVPVYVGCALLFVLGFVLLAKKKKPLLIS